MIAEPDRIVPPAGARMMFLDTLQPLPLIDPTEAARFLGFKPHTLACYRNQGGGPAHYKFGRWVRYAWADLQEWVGLYGADVAWLQPDLAQLAASSPLLLVDTPTAARFLAVTRFCLENYRPKGGGPRFCRFGRRIHYPVAELARWAASQRHPGAKRLRSAAALRKNTRS